MRIDVVPVGELETNCYILEFEGDALIIDPGDEAEKILTALEGRKIVGIVITHHHFDHDGALDEIRDFTKTQVYDKRNLSEGKNRIGVFEFECLYTPGHKEDAITLYFKDEKKMFVGDFIFRGSIGRWDFEGGSTVDMKKSIDKILEYSDDIVLYPGHGGLTSLGQERKSLEYYRNYF